MSAGQILQLQLNSYSSNSKTCPCFFCNKINNESFDKNKEKNEIHNLNYDNSLSDPFLRLYDSNSNLLDKDDDLGLIIIHLFNIQPIIQELIMHLQVHIMIILEAITLFL